MTDAEMIKLLRNSPFTFNDIVADRIEALVADVAGWISNAQAARDYQCEAEYKLEATDSALVKAKRYIEELEWHYGGPRTVSGNDYYAALAVIEKPE